MEKISKGMNKLVNRTKDDPFFIGWAIHEYMRGQNISWHELSVWLECPADNIPRLSLCRLPADTDSSFNEDVIKIAEYTQCNPIRIMMLIREAYSIAALSQEGEDRNEGFLLAARDRDNPNDREDS